MREISDKEADRLYDLMRVIAAHLRQLAYYESREHDGQAHIGHWPLADMYRMRWHAALDLAVSIESLAVTPPDDGKKRPLFSASVPRPPRPWRALHDAHNAEPNYWPLPSS